MAGLPLPEGHHDTHMSALHLSISDVQVGTLPVAFFIFDWQDTAPSLSDLEIATSAAKDALDSDFLSPTTASALKVLIANAQATMAQAAAFAAHEPGTPIPPSESPFSPGSGFEEMSPGSGFWSHEEQPQPQSFGSGFVGGNSSSNGVQPAAPSPPRHKRKADTEKKSSKTKKSKSGKESKEEQKERKKSGPARQRCDHCHKHHLKCNGGPGVCPREADSKIPASQKRLATIARKKAEAEAKAVEDE